MVEFGEWGFRLFNEPFFKLLDPRRGWGFSIFDRRECDFREMSIRSVRGLFSRVQPLVLTIFNKIFCISRTEEEAEQI